MLQCCDRIWEKGPFRAKRDFSAFFKLLPFKGLKSPGLLSWFLSSLDLPLHRPNVRSYSKPPVPSAEPPKRGIKRRFSNAIDARSPWAGSEFLASVVGWWKNIHTRFEDHSCYGSRDISVLKRKFGKCAKWSLISYLYIHQYCTSVVCVNYNRCALFGNKTLNPCTNMGRGIN